MWTRPTLTRIRSNASVGAEAASDKTSTTAAILTAGALAVGIGAYAYLAESPEDTMRRTYSK